MAERLTDRTIAAIKPPTAGSVYYFDTEVAGLAVRVYATGRKVFVFDWRERQSGRQRRVTLGRSPAWTIGKAREHAGRLRLKADVGDTVAPRHGLRVAVLAEKWRGVVELTRRPLTARSYLRLLDNLILPRFGRGEAAAITRNAIEQWHGEIAQTRPIEANRAVATLSAFLSWLEHDRVIPLNPAKGIRRRPENARSVFLDEREIAAAHDVLAADHDRAAALALRLALLTGCRIGEAIALAPAQIDVSRAVWVKPAAATKQRRLHIAPLSKAALLVAQELLRDDLPDYPACRRTWNRARIAIGRQDVRIHDLRHSRASALARGGASLVQIGKVLGHTAPSTTARYAHLIDRDLIDLVERTA
ncbi:MAG: tyrosine-type recombinase/integrase [Microvirga sp.]